MMRPSAALPVVYVCAEPVDFRKGSGSLAILVEGTLALNPFSSHLFVFCNRRRDRVKVLYWERNGFCLWQKRLERGRFHWPQARGNGIVELTGQQLNWLLDGIDINRMKPHEALHFSSVL
ncbi:MAG: IS66 family insertion sequence element accessory protein TnpB [Gammaproteobacteria bacterium]|nr:IS66 family insertion sequence element accessory protein TnpB [Gammaproteobacteria bacterium]